MFGYMAVSMPALTKEEQGRYQAHYCGLCRALGREFGQAGRLTLSNDMTFLAILLASLYEPKEDAGKARCPLHPLKKRDYLCSEALSYAAHMNLLLSYYKLRDNQQDDHNPFSGLGAGALRPAFRQVQEKYPAKCAHVAHCLESISQLEKENSRDVDALCNLSGEMLGEIFAWKDDAWAPVLRSIGEGLGRFIYFMDAYEDYEADGKKGRFNPLVSLHEQADYEAFCLETMKMLIAEATENFEFLPLEKDLSILRNVMYTGVWAHYARMHQKEWKKKEHPDE